jgi:hypothetical protein
MPQSLAKKHERGGVATKLEWILFDYWYEFMEKLFEKRCFSKGQHLENCYLCRRG